MSMVVLVSEVLWRKSENSPKVVGRDNHVGSVLRIRIECPLMRSKEGEALVVPFFQANATQPNLWSLEAGM
jgi:hypothetical protein